MESFDPFGNSMRKAARIRVVRAVIKQPVRLSQKTTAKAAFPLTFAVFSSRLQSIYPFFDSAPEVLRRSCTSPV